MHKKTLILTLLLICFMLTAPLPIKAAMRINGITLPDISSISSSQIGDLSYVLDDADDYKIFFYVT
ncbi:MAG: hypothetical protein UZ21_OP11001000360 [Microgenomates bacterium OLB22]|nr:MAG: hypothetical protein UZ21_OP11001000360 [Microgenomates bacterium OLB22]